MIAIRVNVFVGECASDHRQLALNIFSISCFRVAYIFYSDEFERGRGLRYFQASGGV
jgi:hypothetical protein